MQITLPVTSRVRVQLRELHHILWDIATVDSEENKVIWRWDKNGSFSIKSTYRRFINGGLTFADAKFTWPTNCSPRVKIFLWLIDKQALLTWLDLRKWDWICPNMCMLCQEEGESV